MEYLQITIAMLVLALSTGCPPPRAPDGEAAPKRVEVEAEVKDGEVLINEEHHTTAFVKPGERVEWACRCDPELEFTVAKLRPIFSLEHLAELDLTVLEGAVAPGPAMTDEERIETLEILAPAFPALRVATERQRGEAPEEKQDAADGSHGPDGWSTGIPPDRFTDGTGTILSPPVPQGTGFIVWKFTWRVRHKTDHAECDDSDSKCCDLDPKCDEWDPHIVTHPDTLR